MPKVSFPETPKYLVWTHDRSFESSRWDAYDNENEAIESAKIHASQHDANCIFYVFKATHIVKRAKVFIEKIKD